MITGYFWDSNIWSCILLFGCLFASLMIANVLKYAIPPLRKTLLPSSVLGGLILLIVSAVIKATGGKYLFELDVFSMGDMSGIGILEMITYHCLAFSFIAMGLRKSEKNTSSRQRTVEIFNTGVTTVSTYLLQAVVGIIITSIAAFYLPTMISGAGVLLALGFGQSTGQALNFGSLYENSYGFVGGKSFGLTIAALGFLCASICGVLYLNILKRKGLVEIRSSKTEHGLKSYDVEEEDEYPMSESMDKLTVQIGFIIVVYAIAYLIMWALGNIVGEGLKATIYGFNFLIGTLVAVLVKSIMNALRKRGLIKRDYINNFLMNRITGFSCDLMILAGIGAIQLYLIKDYALVIALLGIIGSIVTFYYVRYVCRKLFPAYAEEQFMAMFGMLTGTASTGMILLRELDNNFETPVSENLVYQNIPAIIFGFPMMFLASYAPISDFTAYVTLGAAIVLLVLMNVILFRSKLFKKRFAKG